jgi:hypothetical protein
VNFSESNDVNPLSYTGNMSDAMLILAVGIMLALIIHWNVDVSTSGGEMSDSGMTLQQQSDGQGGDSAVSKDNAVSFDGEDLQEVDDSQDLSQGGGMDKLGEVYYDEGTGKYYVVRQMPGKE